MSETPRRLLGCRSRELTERVSLLGIKNRELREDRSSVWPSPEYGQNPLGLANPSGSRSDGISARGLCPASSVWASQELGLPLCQIARVNIVSVFPL